MVKELNCTQFGNPILRQKAKQLSPKQVQSKKLKI